MQIRVETCTQFDWGLTAGDQRGNNGSTLHTHRVSSEDSMKDLQELTSLSLKKRTAYTVNTGCAVISTCSSSVCLLQFWRSAFDTICSCLCVSGTLRSSYSHSDVVLLLSVITFCEQCIASKEKKVMPCISVVGAALNSFIEMVK